MQIFIAIIVFVSYIFYYHYKSKKESLNENIEISKILENLKFGMMEYICTNSSSYTKNDVDMCISILENYLSEISVSRSKQEGKSIISKTVLSLNELNEKCDSELIETNERELICEVIILGGNLKGYNTKDEDITEEFREW